MSENNGTQTTEIMHATGLIVLEVRHSNPNGDPDRDSDPRQRRSDNKGYITDVSFKRKTRTLIEDKEGAVWMGVKGQRLPEHFDIFESRRHNRADIEKQVKDDFDKFQQTYWDARVFGNTVLQEKGGDTIRTGVAQFGVGLSVAPIEIERSTLTKIAPSSGDSTATRGMAPMGLRVVRHGVYCLPFIINPSTCSRTGCKKDDIELLLEVIPYAYSHTLSHSRSMVEIRHAWYMEHKSALGCCSDFQLIDAMTPIRKGDPKQPSLSWDDYDVPTDFSRWSKKEQISKDKKEITGRVTLVDLMEERAWQPQSS